MNLKLSLFLGAGLRRRLSLVGLALAAIAAMPRPVAQGAFLSGTGGAPSDPLLALGVTINFDSTPVISSTSTTIGNVKFVGTDGPFRISNDYITQYNTNGLYSLQTGNDVPSPFFYPGNWEFQFTVPVNAFAFNFGASDDLWLMKAYDVGNNLLDSQIIPLTGGNDNDEYFGIAATGIKKVVLIDQFNNYPATGDQIFIDDFTYAIELAPEPSTVVLGLIGIGVGLVAVFRNRRRKNGIVILPLATQNQ